VNDTRLIQAASLIAQAQALVNEMAEELTGDHKDWMTAAGKVLDIAHRAVRNVSLR
jgi:hypothetical protein